MKITEHQRHLLVGLASIGIDDRKRVNRTEDAIDAILCPEAKYPDAGSEIVFNGGEDPVKAIDDYLNSIDVEVTDRA